jgi:hypothetical protein
MLRTSQYVCRCVFQKSKRNHGFTNVKISTRSGREIETKYWCMRLNATIVTYGTISIVLSKRNIRIQLSIGEKRNETHSVLLLISTSILQSYIYYSLLFNPARVVPHLLRQGCLVLGKFGHLSELVKLSSKGKLGVFPQNRRRHSL